MSSSVLVVILNYRTAGTTLSAVSAAWNAMAGLDGGIVVVDNASGDGSFEALRDGIHDSGWDRVQLVQSDRNGGFGAGNNLGIRTSLPDGRPDYVYILNSDAFPERDAIVRLATYLDGHPEAVFVGSYIHGPDGVPHHTCFRFPSIASEFEQAAATGPISRLLKNYRLALPVPDHSCRVDWLAGASLMMRRVVLDDIGLFDETFFLYFEETDLCLRAAAAGGEVHFVRDSVVTHIGSLSTGMKTWDRVPEYWFRSRWHYFAKNHGLFYAALATGAVVAGGLLFRLRRVLSPGRTDLVVSPHFLRDLLCHDLAALFSRRG